MDRETKIVVVLGLLFAIIAYLAYIAFMQPPQSWYNREPMPIIGAFLPCTS